MRFFRLSAISVGIASVAWLAGILPTILFDRSYEGYEWIPLLLLGIYPLVAGLSLWLARRTRHGGWLLLHAPLTAYILYMIAFVAWAIVDGI